MPSMRSFRLVEQQRHELLRLRNDIRQGVAVDHIEEGLRVRGVQGESLLLDIVVFEGDYKLASLPKQTTRTPETAGGLKVTGLGLEPRTISLKGRCSTN